MQLIWPTVFGEIDFNLYTVRNVLLKVGGLVCLNIFSLSMSRSVNILAFRNHLNLLHQNIELDTHTSAFNAYLL